MGHEIRNQVTTCTEGDAEGRTEKKWRVFGVLMANTFIIINKTQEDKNPHMGT